MSQQGKRKTKRLLDFQARIQLGTPGGAKSSKKGTNFSKGGFASSGYGPVDFYTSQKINIFLRTLSVLTKFDLANQGVRQPVQLHIFNAQLPVFDETLAQPYFVVVNCSDVVMSVFHSPVLTRSLIFLLL